MGFIELITTMQSAVEIVNYNHGTNIEIYRISKMRDYKQVVSFVLSDGTHALDRVFDCSSIGIGYLTAAKIAKDISNEWFKKKAEKDEEEREYFF